MMGMGSRKKRNGQKKRKNKLHLVQILWYICFLGFLNGSEQKLHLIQILWYIFWTSESLCLVCRCTRCPGRPPGGQRHHRHQRLAHLEAAQIRRWPASHRLSPGVPWRPSCRMGSPHHPAPQRHLLHRRQTADEQRLLLPHCRSKLGRQERSLGEQQAVQACPRSGAAVLAPWASAGDEMMMIIIIINRSSIVHFLVSSQRFTGNIEHKTKNEKIPQQLQSHLSIIKLLISLFTHACTHAHSHTYTHAHTYLFTHKYT